MKTQEEYAREIDEIVRRDVESYQSDWFKIDKEKMQELRHKFRNQILEYWGEDTGILIGITMVYERHLWNEEVKVI